MKIKNCIKVYGECLLLGAICVFACVGLFADTVPERYNVIISRAPFGTVNYEADKGTNSQLTVEQLRLQEELAKEAELLGKNIKLTAITTYQGVPAAGIIEQNTRRTYYLTKGQSILGYTLTDIGENSILLETTNAIANIAMSYAPGQPAEITVHPTSGRLSALNIFSDEVSATNSVMVKAQSTENGSIKSNADGLELSDEVRKAVTIKDADGTERISFRELHKLRMEERNRKLEEERLAREEKALAEQRAREEEKLKQEELQRIIEAEELLIDAEAAVVEQASQELLPDMSVPPTNEEYIDFPVAPMGESIDGASGAEF
jgi:hypothetical protein